MLHRQITFADRAWFAFGTFTLPQRKIKCSANPTLPRKNELKTATGGSFILPGLTQITLNVLPKKITGLLRGINLGSLAGAGREH